MRLFNHGWKSLVRRPAKTIMLLVILFVVFNLIFVGFIIRNSVSKSKQFIRDEIGGAVEYRVDMTSFINANGPNAQRNNIQSKQQLQIPTLSQNVADKISKSSYVSQYFVSETSNVNSDTLKPAQTQSSTGSFQGQGNFSDFTLKGSNVPQGIDFVLGSIALKDGSFPTQANADNGDAVIMVSEAVAKANNLRVNDKVKLGYVSRSLVFIQGQGGDRQNSQQQQPQNQTTVSNYTSYTVIGIYETKNADFNVNTLLTNNKSIYTLTNRTVSDNTNASIVFLLNHPEEVDAFIKENKPYLTSPYHMLYSNDQEYANLTRPLNLLSVITSLLISVVFVAGAAIILAIVTIFVRDRKFEIGLLLSSGEGRGKIIAQFIFEMMMIAILAFGISAASSNLIAKGVGSWIVNEQLLNTSSALSGTTTTANQLPNIVIKAGGPFGGSTSNLYGSVNMKDVAAEFDASISASVFGQLLLTSLLLVMIGSCVPLVVIMGYNPRRILQDY